MDEMDGMTASEYCAVRRGLGLTQAELAWRLGVSAQTIRNREAGRARVPVAEARLMRAWASGRFETSDLRGQNSDVRGQTGELREEER